MTASNSRSVMHGHRCGKVTPIFYILPCSKNLSDISTVSGTIIITTVSASAES